MTRLWAIPVLAALTVLPVAAGASPSDPIWIAGIYDSADGDDVIALIADTVASNLDDGCGSLSRLCLSHDLTHPWSGISEGARSRERQRGPPRLRARHASSAPPYGPGPAAWAARPPPFEPSPIRRH